MFGGAEAIAIVVSSSEQDNTYQKSVCLQSWLWGYEFTDTIFVHTGHKVHFVTSAKKAKYLEVLLNGPTEVEITILGNDTSFKNIVSDLNHKKVATVMKDRNLGKLGQSWEQEMVDVEQVDGTLGFSMCLAYKDSEELQLVSIAARASAAIMKNFFIVEMSTIVDEDQKVTHEKLTTKIEDLLGKDAERNAKKYLFPEADVKFCDWCYVPIVQSGKHFDLRPSAQSNKNYLEANVIICSLGIRYRDYCSNVTRTFLINPTKEQEKNYDFLLELHNYTVTLLRPQTKCSEVYQKSMEFVRSKRPDLVDKMLKYLGFGMGIEFRESMYALSPTNDNQITENSVFNLVIGFQDIQDDKSYALMVADTVLITKEKTTLVTSKAPRESGEVSFYIEEEEDQKKRPERTTAVLQSKRKQPAAHEQELKRKEHQSELHKKKQEEGLSRFSRTNEVNNLNEKPVFRKFCSYKTAANIPKDAGLMICIDQKNESVLLPICGQIVPFHISTIKNVTKSEEVNLTYLRINFLTPQQVKKEEMQFENPNATFVKTLTYRSPNVPHMNDVYRQITELRKISIKTEAERKNKAEIVEQDVLLEMKTHRQVVLSDVFAKPSLDTKKSPGDLQIHSNGLRYVSRTKTENNIDLLFSNIQHLIFQPCDNELMVILHMHLKNPILIGKKKSKDVQFLRELSDVNFEETGKKKRQIFGDDDELAQEQEERKRRVRLNQEFKDFGEKIVESSQLELDIPYRDLAFEGAPFRSNVLLQPTSDCLVNLTDHPCFVITLSDIEIVHFERCQFGLKSFDMVIVFCDFQRPVFHVNSIPTSELQQIKDWLDSMNICFSEGEINLNWLEIMKTINKDPVEFFESGGWSFLNNESVSESEEESDQSAHLESESSSSDDYTDASESSLETQSDSE